MGAFRNLHGQKEGMAGYSRPWEVATPVTSSPFAAPSYGVLTSDQAGVALSLSGLC